MKQLLNNMSFEERQNIREQHTGGMEVMSGSFRRLVNAKLGNSKPLISEQTAPPAPDSTIPTPQAPQKPSLPKCLTVMVSSVPSGIDQNNMGGSGSSLSGPIDEIKFNGTVSPEYQGYTVHKDGKPFCFIPLRPSI